MDGERFNSLARLVGASTSRRRALKLLGGGVLGALLGRLVDGGPRPAAAAAGRALGTPTRRSSSRSKIASRTPAAAITSTARKYPPRPTSRRRPIAEASAPAPQACPPGQVPTPDAEVNAGGVSVSLPCQCRPCPPGTTFCNNACHGPGPRTQVWNPNTCVCECPPGTYLCPSDPTICFTVTCSGGKVPDPATCQCKCPSCPGGKAPDPDTCECRCTSLTCPQGQVQDPTTCRCMCLEGCPPGQTQDPATCACTCGGSSCAGTCCNRSCVDLQTDRANCGRCGNACTGGKTCQNGRCACPSGTSECLGRCLDTGTKCEPAVPSTCPSSGGCYDSPPCNSNAPGCACMTTTEGTGACVPNPHCDDVPPCLVSANCGSGSACVALNCCKDGLPRCVPLCSAQVATIVPDARRTVRALPDPA